MPEVPAHLVPTDGLTNATIEFRSLDHVGGGAADVVFQMFDENKNNMGQIVVHVKPTRKGTADAQIAEGHRVLCDMLRQWLYVTDKLRQEYEKR